MGAESGYIYYPDFSSLEYHRVHTETPALLTVLLKWLEMKECCKWTSHVHKFSSLLELLKKNIQYDEIVT